MAIDLFAEPKDLFAEPQDLFQTAPPKQEEAGIFSRETLTVPSAHMANLVETATTGIAGSIAGWVGQPDIADAIFKGMDMREESRNQWANPKNKKLTIPGQVAGGLWSGAGQMALSGLQMPKTMQELVKSGENKYTALQAGLITEAGAAIAAIPLIGPTFGKWGARVWATGIVNAAQSTAVDLGIATLVEHQENKDRYAPSWEKATVAFAVGAMTHAVVARDSFNKQRSAYYDNLPDRVAEGERILAERQAEAVMLQKKIDDQKAEVARAQEIYKNLQNPDNQLPIPFTNNVDDIAAVASTREEPFKTTQEVGPQGIENPLNKPIQQDMFEGPNAQQVDFAVDQLREPNPGSIRLQETQKTLQTLLAKQKEIVKEIDIANVKDQIETAYVAHRAEQSTTKSLEESVARLQDKFHVPKGQRGALNMEMFKDDYLKTRQFVGKDGRNYYMSVEGQEASETVHVVVKDEKGYQVAGANFGPDGQPKFISQRSQDLKLV